MDGCPRNQCHFTFAEQERANSPVRLLGLCSHCLEGTLSGDSLNLLPSERESKELGDLFYSRGQILKNKNVKDNLLSMGIVLCAKIGFLDRMDSLSLFNSTVSLST